MSQLDLLLRQINTELKRADRVYSEPPAPHPNASNLRNLEKYPEIGASWLFGRRYCTRIAPSSS